MSDRILDSIEIRGISADGDDRVTLILLTWDYAEEAYQVERRCEGQYEDSQIFYDRDIASQKMDEWAGEARYHYHQEKLSYDRGENS